jgi:uncharacterized protein YlxW (UPF0749 family)
VDGLREISETKWKKEVDEMKTVMISIVLVCFVFTGPSIAASSTQEDQKKDYQEKIETKLKEFDQKLEELKEKVNKIEKE